MAEFIVSARKYRPSHFDDVIGQGHITQTLKMALEQGRIAHSFLFSGPRGVGKTTCARILAKALNCTQLTADHEPCGVCESCKAFNENASFSIFELDAASNNSVDNIRSLVEQVRFPPQTGKYKIFIIDEVHMLSTQAFNAFLKTLEEPPSYAIFILATTEQHKILPTILSRCQIFDFRRLRINDIVKQLDIICQTENIQATPEALHLIADKADGAMRDALSIFDRIAGSQQGNITFEAVIENLNILDYSYYFRLFDMIQSQDVPSLMTLLDEIINRGFDPEVILNGMSAHIRNLLMCKDISTIDLIENTDAVKDKFQSQAALASFDALLTALDICVTTDGAFRNGQNKRLHLEMAFLRMTFASDAIIIEQKIQENVEVKKNSNSQLTTDSTLHALNPKDQVVTESAHFSESFSNDSLDSDDLRVTVPYIPDGQSGSSHPDHLQGDVVLSSNDPLPKDQNSKLDNSLNEESRELPASKPKNEVNKKVNKLAHFESSAKAKQDEIKDLKVMFDEDKIRLIWQEYMMNAPSGVKSIMQQRPIHLKPNLIEIVVGSEYEKSTLLNETELLEQIRTDQNNRQIRLTIEVNEDLLAEFKKTKPLSSGEKLLKLIEMNPKINDLIQVLDAKVE